MRARYAFRSRTGLLVIGGGLAAVGMYMGWDWLVAAGLAPVVLAVLPCVAMCAAGLCMIRIGGKPCSPAAQDTDESDVNTPLMGPADTTSRKPVRENENR
jgi:hypothetical protein